MRLIQILALTYEEGLAQWYAAQAKADVYDTLFYLFIFWIFVYTVIICVTGAMGWYKNIRHSSAVIIGMFVVLFVLTAFVGNRSVYWDSWTPNFFV